MYLFNFTALIFSNFLFRRYAFAVKGSVVFKYKVSNNLDYLIVLIAGVFTILIIRRALILTL